MFGTVETQNHQLTWNTFTIIKHTAVEQMNTTQVIQAEHGVLWVFGLTFNLCATVQSKSPTIVS